MKYRKPRIINEDLVGQKFGLLSVIKKIGLVERKTTWLCRCDCGTEKEFNTGRLKRGHAKNCGCVARNNPRFVTTPRGDRVRHPSYYNWTSMKSRCYSRNDTSYEEYGARGIFVCDRWLGRDGFANFDSDMGPKPSEKHTIGRKRSADPYSPETCRWETAFEQGQNKSNARLITVGQKTQTITAWCREMGLSIGGIHWRLRREWTIERAVSTPNLRKSRQSQVKTETAGVKESSVVADPRDWLAD